MQHLMEEPPQIYSHTTIFLHVDIFLLPVKKMLWWGELESSKH